MNYSDADKALILKYAGVNWEPGRKCVSGIWNRNLTTEQKRLLILRDWTCDCRWVHRGGDINFEHDIPAPPLDSSVAIACLRKAAEGRRPTYQSRAYSFILAELARYADRDPVDIIFTAVLALQKENPDAN